MGCPCKDCLEQGCGRHSSCERYVEYWNTNRKHDKARKNQAELMLYVAASVKKTMRTSKSSLAKYHQSRKVK